MTWTIRIKRQKHSGAAPYYQEFPYEGDAAASIAVILMHLNETLCLDNPIHWQHSCHVRKCGACAMVIDGIPRLACSTFLRQLKGPVITLEPLGKFPVIADLIVDRTRLYSDGKDARLWLSHKVYPSAWSQELRYQSARCIYCGCCLEVCPNFSIEKAFGGAALAVNAYRILQNEPPSPHRDEVKKVYKAKYYETCGLSLACQDICPARIPVTELLAHANALLNR